MLLAWAGIEDLAACFKSRLSVFSFDFPCRIYWFGAFSVEKSAFYHRPRVNLLSNQWHFPIQRGHLWILNPLHPNVPRDLPVIRMNLNGFRLSCIMMIQSRTISSKCSTMYGRSPPILSRIWTENGKNALICIRAISLLACSCMSVPLPEHWTSWPVILILLTTVASIASTSCLWKPQRLQWWICCQQFSPCRAGTGHDGGSPAPDNYPPQTWSVFLDFVMKTYQWGTWVNKAGT